MRREYTQEGLLPSGYRQLEYLQSTGTQYISIPTPHERFRMEYDAQHMDYSGRVSGYFGLDNNNIGVSFGILCNSDYYKVAVQQSNNYTWTNITRSDNNRHIFIIDYIDTRKASVDSAQLSLGDVYRCDGKGTALMLIFGMGGWNGVIDTLAKVKVWSYRLWYGGELKHDLIPALRKSDSKPGLYDIVNNVFYTNQGTGEFLYA